MTTKNICKQCGVDHIGFGHKKSLPDLKAMGLTYRRLDYWTRVGWIKAGNHPGSGHRRAWDPDEVAVAARMVRLTAAGFTVARAAELARLPAGEALIGDGVWLNIFDTQQEEATA